VAKKNNIDFPSRWRTASGMCITLTGFFLTVYFALQAGCHVLNFDILWPAADNKQDGTFGDPTMYTDQQVEKIMKTTTVLYRVQFASRAVLIVALWTAKFAFVATFLASNYCLGRVMRWTLYGASGVTVACFITSVWLWCGNLIPNRLPDVSADDVRFGGLNGGLSYIYTDFKYELGMTSVNMLSDILLTIVALSIIRALSFARGTSTLLLLMLAFNLSIAATRLALVVEMIKPATGSFALFSERFEIPTSLLSEFEVFFSAIISCLPGMRAWRRRRLEQRDRGVGSSGGISDGDPYTVGTETLTVFGSKEGKVVSYPDLQLVCGQVRSTD